MNEATFQTSSLPMRRDRDAALAELQALGAVHPVDAGLMLLDADLVDDCLRDPATFSSRKAFEQLGSPVPLVPIAFDPPEQTRYRRILQPFFSPKRIREAEADLREQARTIITPLAAKGGCDLVADVAEIFPTQAFLTLFGLPLEDRDRFITWKDAILALSQNQAGDVPPEDLTHAMELYTYLAELIARRRGQSGDDILSQLLRLQGEDALTDEDMLGLTFLFILAGLDTVSGAIGLGFHRLAGRPDLRRQIVEEPALIPQAVEELLRIDPPVPWVPRVCVKDVELAGRHVPAGTYTYVNVATANRCPARWPNPDTVDFRRDANPHSSFGGGPHRCLGSHLARLQLRIVVEEWHRLVPDYALAPGADPTVSWPLNTLRMESLPLVYAPA